MSAPSFCQNERFRVKREPHARLAIDRNGDRELLINNDGTLKLITKHPRDPSDFLERYRRTASDVDLHRFNVRSVDRAYWLSVRLFLQWVAMGIDCGALWARVAYKDLRALLHESKAKEWEDVLPRAIVKWAQAELDKEMEGLSCVDNSRVARKDSTGQVRRYRKQKESGCCGFSDWEARCPIDGKVYLLGFNFGH